MASSLQPRGAPSALPRPRSAWTQYLAPWAVDQHRPVQRRLRDAWHLARVAAPAVTAMRVATVGGAPRRRAPPRRRTRCWVATRPRRIKFFLRRQPAGASSPGLAASDQDELGLGARVRLRPPLGPPATTPSDTVAPPRPAIRSAQLRHAAFARAEFARAMRAARRHQPHRVERERSRRSRSAAGSPGTSGRIRGLARARAARRSL